LSTSSAVSHSVPVSTFNEPVIDAVRYSAVPLLTDSLLHDVRNPLNALSINLEVLTEKLKVEGAVPANQEKNLRAMREQIFRVDATLRLFAEFLAARPGEATEATLSDVLSRALQVVSHESRRRRLHVHTTVEADVKVRGAVVTELAFLSIQPLIRAFHRADADGDVRVSLASEGTRAIFEVSDGAAKDGETAPEVAAALKLACERLGVDLTLRGGQCRMVFSRA